MQDDSQEPRTGGVYLGRDGAAPSELTSEAALKLLDARFPRIAGEIRARWGSKDFDAYLDTLLIDVRGDRAGFPPEAAQALLTLSREHNQRFPRDSKTDPWFWSDPTLYKR